MSADPDVVKFYEAIDEDSRLDADWFPTGRLEFARTKELLLRHLPALPARILDVGGASGRYARWLNELGYDVTVVDPVEKHIAQATSRGVDARLGHAGQLDWPDESIGVVLLLGPLYHLVDPDERAAALREARRVLRHGGIIACAYLSRYTGLFELLQSRQADNAAAWKLVTGAIASGVGPPSDAGFFTTAYFHHRDEIGPELVAADFELDVIYGVEGPGALIADLNARWTDEHQRQRLLDAAKLLETEPTLAGSNPHLLAIAHRPE
jgi:SAM-dependent methyltransferase